MALAETLAAKNPRFSKMKPSRQAEILHNTLKKEGFTSRGSSSRSIRRILAKRTYGQKNE
jgi:hypothetical protein